jgi:hypothetical protein
MNKLAVAVLLLFVSLAANGQCPATVNTGDTITAAYANSVKDALTSWCGNITANGKTIAGAGTISAGAISSSGTITGTGAFMDAASYPQLSFDDQSAPTDEKHWQLFGAPDGSFNLRAHNEASSVFNTALSSSRTGATVDEVKIWVPMKTVKQIDLDDPGSRPTCAVAYRGHVWLDEGGAGVKDSLAVCAKDAGDAYAWRTIY